MSEYGADLANDDVFFAECEKLGYTRAEIQSAILAGRDYVRRAGGTIQPLLEERAALLDSLSTFERGASDDPAERAGLARGLAARWPLRKAGD